MIDLALFPFSLRIFTFAKRDFLDCFFCFDFPLLSLSINKGCGKIVGFSIVVAVSYGNALALVVSIDLCLREDVYNGANILVRRLSYCLEYNCAWLWTWW